MNLVSEVASLAAATSHEINNPLMVVIGRLQLLDRTQQLDASGRMHLEAALAAADEIKEKVHRLGWITRLELADGGLGLPPMLDLEKSSQRTSMKRLGLLTVFMFLPSLLTSGFAVAADDSKVKSATHQVESGAKKISDGKVGEGVAETATGIGKTVSEGAKYSGEKLKEAGKAAEPPAKTAWGNARAGAVAFGHTVTVFFASLFSK